MGVRIAVIFDEIQIPNSAAGRFRVKKEVQPMKRLFLSLFALVLALPAMGQNYYKVTRGVTIAGAATNTSTVYPNLRNARVVGVKLSFAGADTGTDNVIAYFDGSLNGSTWDLAAIGSLTVAATDTTATSGTATIDTGGFTLMRVRVKNASSTVSVTNVVVEVALKRGVEPVVPIEVAYGGTGAATAANARTALGVPAATGGTLTTTTLAGATTASGLSASLPVWTMSNKVLTNYTAAQANDVLDVAAHSALTASLPVWTMSNKVLTNQTVANFKLLSGFQSGTATTGSDGTVTVTFPVAYSAAPNVVISFYGDVNTTSPTNIITSITTTNFVINTAEEGVTNKWIAIGAP